MWGEEVGNLALQSRSSQPMQLPALANHYGSSLLEKQFQCVGLKWTSI